MSNKGKLMKAGVRVRLSPRKPLVKGCFLSLRLQLVVDHLAEASASDLEPGVSPDQVRAAPAFLLCDKNPAAFVKLFQAACRGHSLFVALQGPL